MNKSIVVLTPNERSVMTKTSKSQNVFSGWKPFEILKLGNCNVNWTVLMNSIGQDQVKIFVLGQNVLIKSKSIKHCVL